MGLRIQNNIEALNAQRQLSIANTGLSKSLERLSSGYRINKAADDAAGLSISQSFRADIASYKVAQRNVSEANSLLQVAEGGLDQIGNMLTRMKELATQASSSNSGSNLSKINAEYSELMLEVDRIVNSSEYADTALLDGTFGASLTGTLGDATADMGIIDTNVHWEVTGDLATNDETVTAFGSSTSEGTWTIS
ncbi:MAG: flagellin, partial [Thermodesulfobacteriota bacterium]|nr:flagellin [Thermodesulfobacteriota bacterium]